MTVCEVNGGLLVVGAVYFFFAGIVAEHSSSNIHKEISSPIPSVVRGLMWPLILIKYLLLMIIWSIK
jgi:hypothetical protein